MSILRKRPSSNGYSLIQPIPSIESLLMPLKLGNVELKICDQSYDVEIQFRYLVLSFVFYGANRERSLSNLLGVCLQTNSSRRSDCRHFGSQRRHVLPDAGARLHTRTQNAERVDTFE